MRYYAFGETRLSTGTMLTDRLFTGQRQIAELGIYHYNARFYSPTLGRFLSADTLMSGFANPQNLNRFSYALNNPVRYTDPTGHSPYIDPGPTPYDPGPDPYDPPDHNDGGDGDGGGSDSDWEEQVFQNLYDLGGPEGMHAVDYMLQNDVHLIFNQETQPAAWHPWSNDIYLDSDQYSLASDPANPYMLSVIAHEAVHLEQGGLPKAITLAGEVEAWQIGFTVYQTMTGQLPSGKDPLAAGNIMTLDANNLSQSDLENTRQWMTDFDSGYRSDLLLPWAEDSDAYKLFTASIPYIPPLVPIP
jgi:RHS repeat-associated protein